MTKTTATVFCRLQIDGTHNWPACDVEGVDFLRHTHRHMFHIEAHAEVTHSDRDVEFIALKRKIQQYFAAQQDVVGQVAFGAQSCEMIAETLINTFNLVECTVSEDGENGATVKVVAE